METSTQNYKALKAEYGFIKIAAVCPKVTVANPIKNVQGILEDVKKAHQNAAQIIVLPELSISSASCGDLFLQDRLIEKCYEALSQLLSCTKDIDALIFAGIPVRVYGRLYNCAAAIMSGELLGIVPKSYITEKGDNAQKRFFTSGIEKIADTVRILNKEVPFGKIIFCDKSGAKIAVEIGDDMNVPVTPSAISALNGANIIVNLSAQNELVSKNEYRLRNIEQLSAKLSCAYAYANAGVHESTTDYVFSGACTICENGKILADSERFSRDGSCAYACVDIKNLEALRNKSEFYDNAVYYKDKDIKYIDISLAPLSEDKLDRQFNSHPFISQDEKQSYNDAEEILNIQACALAKRMEHTHTEKLILGISGGLDSALALLVADRALDMLKLPKKNLICITLPGFGTTGHTKSSALKITDCIGAEEIEINIVPACTQHMHDIGHDMNILDVTYQNVQARERTQILMDIANHEGALLVGTGDLSELALGWCTYNADQMSMYSVNCCVPKTLVRQLCAHEAKKCGGDLGEVLMAIVNTPISPELLPPDKNGKIEQKTEDTLGPYEVHDFIIYHFLRFNSDPEKIRFMLKRAFKGEYKEEELDKWFTLFIKRFFSQQFKRTCSPDGPKVGTVGLSPRGSLVMPSDADCSAWL